MSKRQRKQRTRQSPPTRLGPKPGPGGIYIRELVSARSGCEERYRNIGEHPLTLAHARRKISDEQFAAGDEFRALCELRLGGTRDSTDMVPGAGGAGACFTQTQIDAARRLERLRAGLKARDWIILEKFCGEGWSMAEAVRAATLCHPSGVLFRVQEALDELVTASRERTARSREKDEPEMNTCFTAGSMQSLEHAVSRRADSGWPEKRKDPNEPEDNGHRVGRHRCSRGWRCVCPTGPPARPL
jgi:hypothetical protein